MLKIYNPSSFSFDFPWQHNCWINSNNSGHFLSANSCFAIDATTWAVELRTLMSVSRVKASRRPDLILKKTIDAVNEMR